MSECCTNLSQEDRDLNLAWNLYARAFDLMVHCNNLELAAKLLAAAHGLLQSGSYANYEHSTGAELYNGDGVLSLLSGNAIDAETSFCQALAVSIRVNGPDTIYTAAYRSNLAQALAAQKNYQKAEPEFQAAIATLEVIKAKACEHIDLTDVNAVLADAEREYAVMQAALGTVSEEQ